MRRIARVLIVALLAPTLVLLSGPGAQAAVYGTPGTADMKFRDYLGSVNCNLVAYYSVNQLPLTGGGIKYRVKCSEMDTNLSHLVGGAEGHSQVTFKGGPQCIYTDDSMTVGSEGNGSGIAGFDGMGPGMTLCPATEVCMSLRVERTHAWDSDYGSECRPITLGTIPGNEPPVTGCFHGNPAGKPQLTEPFIAQAGSYKVQKVRVTQDMKDASTSQVWRMYVVTKRANGYWRDWNWTQPITGETLGLDIGVVGVDNNTGASVMVREFEMGDTHASAPPINAEVVGVGMIMRNGSSWPSNFLTLPQANSAGKLGIHNPSACQFYWGTKVADTIDSTDEPAGALPLPGEVGGGSLTEPTDDPAPPEDAPNCDFSLGDPSTWLNGGMCAVVGALMWLGDMLGRLLGSVVDILGNVVGVLGDVVEAVLGLVADLLDGLVGLFVPDAEDLDDEVAGLRAAWNDTAPGAWGEAFTGQGFSPPAGSCGGLPVNFTLPGDVGVDMHIGEACAGPAATAASLVKLAVTVGLVIFGALACIRAVGSGMGWDPGVGRGEA